MFLEFIIIIINDLDLNLFYCNYFNFIIIIIINVAIQVHTMRPIVAKMNYYYYY